MYMNITPQYVNKILKALPISYYCKRNVSVELTMEPNSYYSLSDDFIRVSYHNVYNIISKLKDETYLETSLRSLLYHEVAHAMLTPPSMITDAWMNIFEDERIERLTKDFFVGVDY